VQKNSRFIWSVAIITNIIIIRLFLVPLQEKFQLNYFPFSWSSLSIASVIRLAIGSFLSGLCIVARYIGPQSIVRCSSSPLKANSSLKYLHFLHGVITGTKTNIIRGICEPDDLQKSLFLRQQQRNKNPRRLQLPTSWSFISQFFLSVAIAAVIANVTLIPMCVDRNYGDDLSSTNSFTLLCVATITTVMIMMIIPAFFGNQEISPATYRSSDIGNCANIVHYLKSTSQTIMWVYVCVIFLISTNSFSSMEHVNLIYFVLATFAIFIYMAVFDYTLKFFYCNNITNIKKLVQDSSGGDASIDTFLTVILHSLLHSNERLVESIINNPPSYTSACVDFDQEERKRNEAAIEMMVNILLNKSDEDEAGPHFEDDILRLAIMNSLGSSESNGKYSVGVINAEEGGLPISRALCCYIGGLGESLRRIAETEDMFFCNEWEVPNGTIYMGECAIRGLTRMIIHNLNLTSLSPNIPPKNAAFEIIIPIFLSSLYQMQNGLERFALQKSGSKSLDPHFLPLFNLCNINARMVVENFTVRKKERIEEFLAPFDFDCKSWLESKFAK